MKNEIDPLIEWAVWGQLDSEKNLELILLKGHLLLEIVLDEILARKDIQTKDFSFHRKIIAFEKISFKNREKKEFIISSLRKLNNLRNRLAHEFNFDVKNGELKLWAVNILKNLSGTKHTKYTFRTKIVHAFSILSKNILELSEEQYL